MSHFLFLTATLLTSTLVFLTPLPPSPLTRQQAIYNYCVCVVHCRPKTGEARREVQRTQRTMQNKWWTEKAQEIQSFADRNDMHNFYNAVKSIYGPTKKFITPLKTADGLRVLKDQSSVLEKVGWTF